MAQNEITTVERGDTYKVYGTEFTVLSVDVLTIRNSEKKTTKRTWIGVGNLKGDYWETLVTDFLDSINSAHVELIGRLPERADEVDRILTGR